MPIFSTLLLTYILGDNNIGNNVLSYIILLNLNNSVALLKELKTKKLNLFFHVNITIDMIKIGYYIITDSSPSYLIGFLSIYQKKGFSQGPLIL